MSAPASIGPYRVLRPLGGGGMGEVFLAYDPRLDREVAIKRIRASSGEDPEHRARLLREARLAAGLSHPAVVQVYDLLSDDGVDHIVMEHVPGTTLREALVAGPFSVARGLPVATAVAEGLAAAHQRGIVHRDLKTENVLLTPEGRVKIADFGIARQLSGAGGSDEGLTRAGMIVGTWRIMSPEQVCGDPVDARTDLFSLGVLLYELFTGRSPFLAETAAATTRRILGYAPPPAMEVTPGIPAPLSDLIEYLFEKDPALRPRTAAEVAERLHALGPGAASGDDATLLPGSIGARPSPPPAPPSSLLPTAPPPPVRRRRAWLAAGAVLLAGVVSAWLWRSEAGRSDDPLVVAVRAPTARGTMPGQDAALLAFTLRGALHSALTSLEGVYPKGAAEVDAVPGPPAAVARAVAADEVIESSFACQARSCSVEVSRLRGSDGAATWSRQIEVPRVEPLTAARAVAVLLREGYPERRPRPGMPEGRIEPRDHAEYLAVWRIMAENPGGDPEPLLSRLAAVRQSSPDLIDAYLLEATLLVNQFSSTHQARHLDRASALLAAAEDRVPGDPEVLFRRAYVEILGGRPTAAATLAAFERQAPGDVRVLDLRARLLERQGRPREALAASRAAVERQPSWVRLLELANLARRQGEIALARETLDRLLATFPENERGRQLLALLELTHGDPARAARLYEELATRSRDPGVRVNLGLARMLQGDYDGAARAIEEAVALERNYLFLLNLGQARLLAGHKSEAEALFREVLARSAGDESRQEWQSATARAQALAHLGERRQAVATVQEALQLAPQNGQVAFEAALVYALVGDRTAALVNAARARELGFEAPGWFRLPWFRSLLSDPGFQALAISGSGRSRGAA